MLYQVKDNKITFRSVPHTYTHEDGSQTVGYNLLSPEELALEGWLRVVDHTPEYDKNTQRLELESETILPDRVNVVYKVVDIPKRMTEQEQIWHTLQYLLGSEPRIVNE